MDNDTLLRIALATLPTGVVSLVALLVVWWRTPTRRGAAPGSRAEPTLWRLLVPVVLVALAGTALYPLVFQSGFPEFPPTRGRFAIPYIGIAALLAGLGVAAAHRLGPRAGVAITAAIAIGGIAAALVLTLRTQLLADGGWERWRAVVGAFGVLAPVFVAGLVLLTRSSRRGLAPALSVFVVAFAVSQLLVVGYHSISESIMAAALCAVVGGLVGAAVFRPSVVFGSAGAVAIGLMMSMLLLQGASFGASDMPWRLVFAAMIAVSPFAALGADLVAGKAGITRAWARGVCMVGGAAALAIGAVAIAGRMYMQEASAGY